MKQYITLTAACLLFLSCATQDAANPACVGTSGKTLSCSVGSCSHSGGAGCSALVDGVACCAGGGSGGGDGTSNCAVGWCWTNPENICCPHSAQYACKGYCYTTNVCIYTSYQSACHN